MRLSTLLPTYLVHKRYGPRSIIETQNSCFIFKDIDHDLTISYKLTVAYPSHLILKRMFKWAVQFSTPCSLNSIPVLMQIIRKENYSAPHDEFSILLSYNFRSLLKLLQVKARSPLLKSVGGFCKTIIEKKFSACYQSASEKYNIIKPSL